MSEAESEILIVGGGFVGAALGLAAAKAGFAVLLVDGGGAALGGRGADPRASMLSRASRTLLERLGALDGMEAALQPVREMVISHGSRSEDGGGASPFVLGFPGAARSGGDAGKEPLAWMVENRHLRAGLQQAMGQCGGLERMTARVVDCAAAGRNRIEARLEGGGLVRARLCVAADGAASRLRGGAGIETVEWRYAGRALTAVVAHEWEHDGVAQEHFLPGGPFAILPLPGRRSSLVWVEEPQAAAALEHCQEEVFLQLARRRMGGRRGALALEGARLSYPVGLLLARRYGAEGLLLAGDAAHAVHPLAGQGLNMGLKDVMALERLWGEARRLGLGLDCAMLLERYERMRRFDNLVMAMVTDGTQRLFRGEGGVLRVLRDLCLGTAQANPWIRAMGERLG